EDSLSKAVVHVFNDLYKKGRLYRGLRMTNWDPEALTVLSNEEVIHADENSRLYHVRYQVEGSDEYIVIATQRPETIMADTGLAVHPDDERYKHLHGKRVIVPIVNRSIPIITDSYVELDFGTGALKVTPAHDPNDYDLGQKYGLEVIDIINLDGSLNELAQVCVGQDRFEARKNIGKILEEAGALVKIEDYRTRVGRSERTNAVVEPKLTLQWFLKMDEFAATALEAVRSDEVTFYPSSMWNMYNSWLKEENVRDWCISRQLWWGQQIPAWYYGEEVFVAHSAEEALEEAKARTGKDDLKLSDLKQDEDVVDTWFSSWLWPISVFDGFDRQDELKYYYPTNTLVTGWDIMFFWVARMIMAGYEWSSDLLGEGHPKMPFHDVYFTGMVRDSKRRKMSKSLGNSPDALKLIDTYGADGVRFGMLSCSSAGNDIIFDAPIDTKTGKALNESKLCEQGRNFCNKMWNALRLIDGFEVDESKAANASDE
ncbi:MAG: class I tRNA ligase family protein, partial [Bacteroidota bacterium]